MVKERSALIEMDGKTGRKLFCSYFMAYGSCIYGFSKLLLIFSAIHSIAISLRFYTVCSKREFRYYNIIHKKTKLERKNETNINSILIRKFLISASFNFARLSGTKYSSADVDSGGETE